MSGQVKIALIGLGWWGRKMLDVLAEAADTISVVRIVEPDVEAARDVASRLNIAHSPDLEDALGDPAVEAVVLATPHALHTAQIEAAVKAGKHVFLRKTARSHSPGGGSVGAIVPTGKPDPGHGPRTSLGTTDRPASGHGRRRRTRPGSADRGQFQPRQVSSARPWELAVETRPGSRWRHDGHGYPSARSVCSLARGGRECPVHLRESFFRFAPGRHGRRLCQIQKRRAHPTFRPRLQTPSCPASRYTAPGAGSTFATRRMWKRLTVGLSRQR